jgi:diaminopimelate decarboxylase
MPMSEMFKYRLFPLIPSITREFMPRLAGDNEFSLNDELDGALSPGFHIYDEFGIRATIMQMKRLLFAKHSGTNFFAVKACPNIQILKIMLEMGFGLDCASPTELYRAKLAGAKAEQIMFTSNNTDPRIYAHVLSSGCILNLDDISFIDKLPEMPERICFRYNPGNRRTEGTNNIIGDPPNQKYGIRHDQIVEAYKRARDKGAKIFGLHTMFVSNCRNAQVLADNAKMLLQVADEIQNMLGIELEFINIGGGFGTRYKYTDSPLEFKLMSKLINMELSTFKAKRGYLPRFFTESGRYVTGPHGVLVARAVNVMDKYKKFIGLNICDACDILRAPMYPAYHEVSILTSNGKEKMAGFGNETVSIVGPLCENMHMVSDRFLPKIKEGDFVIVHNTGAHGLAMKSNYNGWGCSQELLLRMDGSVTRISRAETMRDLMIRELDLPANQLTMTFKHQRREKKHEKQQIA